MTSTTRSSLTIGPVLIARWRAVAALAWAAALAAVGDAGTTLPTAVVLLVAAYPLIDVAASLAGRLRVDATISAVAAAGLLVAGLTSDTGAVLVVFGAWAVVSGLLQLARALRRRSGGTREVPMLVSGGLSAVAGLAIAASSGAVDPGLGMLAGYAAFGAVLFLVWAARGREG